MTPDIQPDVARLLRDIESLAVVPERFSAAVAEFASIAELDPDALLRGETIGIGGVPITLAHYGPLDPDGATVVVDYGLLSQDDGASWRQLLEHNLHTPAGLHGWFALAPERGNVFFCVRVDLAKHDAPGEAIASVVALAVEAVRSMREAVAAQLDAAAAPG